MFFAIIAQNSMSVQASERRQNIRAEHLQGIVQLASQGHIVDGGWILNEDQQQAGALLFCEFPDRSSLDTYLAQEPYIRERIWQTVTVHEVQRATRDSLLAGGGTASAQADGRSLPR